MFLIAKKEFYISENKLIEEGQRLHIKEINDKSAVVYVGGANRGFNLEGNEYVEIQKEGSVTMYKPDDYGGITAVDLDFKNDRVYIRGDLCDECESVQDYLESYHRKNPLYGSILSALAAMKRRGEI